MPRYLLFISVGGVVISLAGLIWANVQLFNFLAHGDWFWVIFNACLIVINGASLAINIKGIVNHRRMNRYFAQQRAELEQMRAWYEDIWGRTPD